MTAPVRPPGTLIFLHGHDDDPDAATADLTMSVGPAWNVVTPAGPVSTDGGRRAWWRSDDDGAPFPADVAEAIACVDDAMARHASTTPVVLGGFSQGGALALALALRQRAQADPDRPRGPDRRDAGLVGVFAVGAWMPDLIGLPADPAAFAARRTPVLVAHGSDDDDVPLLLGRSAARLLDRHGVPVSYLQLDVGHRLGPFVGAIGDWTAAVARGERPTGPI